MLRPRIKPEHAPFRIAGGRIRIGGMTYGIASEIYDPEGFIWTVMRGMDGNRSVDDVVALAAQVHPRVPAQTLRQAAEELEQSGYVEDAGAPDPEELTEVDKERYDRARRYFRWLDLTPRASSWEPQARLRQAAVTVIGIGGTGGAGALALAAAGVGRLHCVDPDVVELSNLSRQILYTEADLGQAKVAAATARLQALNSGIEVTGDQLRVGSAEDAARLAADCDVLLMAADEPTGVRLWVNRGCISAGRPWVDAGYYGPVAQVAAYVPGEGGCWECMHESILDRHRELGAVLADEEDASRTMRAAVGAVSAGISGYLAAHLVIALITGIPSVRPGWLQGVNLAAVGDAMVLEGTARPDCLGCGPSRDH